MSLQAVNARAVTRSLAIDPHGTRSAICAPQQGNDFLHGQKAKKRNELLTVLFRQCAAFCEGWGEAEKPSMAQTNDKENAEEPLRYWERPSWID